MSEKLGKIPTKQVVSYISEDLHTEIFNLARKNFRTMSKQIELLLIQAIKERNRKKSSSSSQQHIEKSRGHK
jgi:hypothetical protein